MYYDEEEWFEGEKEGGGGRQRRMSERDMGPGNKESLVWLFSCVMGVEVALMGIVGLASLPHGSTRADLPRLPLPRERRYIKR